jgi:hypothetical protein
MEGALVNFDTRTIMNNVDLESLTSDEIIEVRSNLGQYQAYLQQKRVVIHPKLCIINIYRVIILSKYENNNAYAVKKMNLDRSTGSAENSGIFSDETP